MPFQNIYEVEPEVVQLAVVDGHEQNTELVEIDQTLLGQIAGGGAEIVPGGGW